MTSDQKIGFLLLGIAALNLVTWFLWIKFWKDVDPQEKRHKHPILSIIGAEMSIQTIKFLAITALIALAGLLFLF